MTFRLHLVTRGFESIVYAIGWQVNAASILNVDDLGLLRTLMDVLGIAYFFCFVVSTQQQSSFAAVPRTCA
jgi:hypothetical protein